MPSVVNGLIDDGLLRFEIEVYETIVALACRYEGSNGETTWNAIRANLNSSFSRLLNSDAPIRPALNRPSASLDTLKSMLETAGDDLVQMDDDEGLPASSMVASTSGVNNTPAASLPAGQIEGSESSTAFDVIVHDKPGAVLLRKSSGTHSLPETLNATIRTQPKHYDDEDSSMEEEMDDGYRNKSPVGKTSQGGEGSLNDTSTIDSNDKARAIINIASELQSLSFSIQLSPPSPPLLEPKAPPPTETTPPLALGESSKPITTGEIESAINDSFFDDAQYDVSYVADDYSYSGGGYSHPADDYSYPADDASYFGDDTPPTFKSIAYYASSPEEYAVSAPPSPSPSSHDGLFNEYGMFGFESAQALWSPIVFPTSSVRDEKSSNDPKESSESNTVRLITSSSSNQKSGQLDVQAPTSTSTKIASWNATIVDAYGEPDENIHVGGLQSLLSYGHRKRAASLSWELDDEVEHQSRREMKATERATVDGTAAPSCEQLFIYKVTNN